MGVFDTILNGIGDNLSDFFNGNDSLSTYATVGRDALAIGGALGAEGSGSLNTSQSTSNVRNAENIVARLQFGTSPMLGRLKNESPIHTKDSFEAAQGANPMALENEWNNRLKRYAEITRETGVSETGR